jgi:FkbM family methyltransferase
MSIKSIGRDTLARLPVLDGLFRRLIWSRIHFPENEMRFLNSLRKNSIDIAVDVGAATGSYAWILNRVSRRVYAFEPGSIHSDYLSKVNFLTSIRVIPTAVGSDCNPVKFYTPGSDTNALHSATVSATNPVTKLEQTSTRLVDQITLDEYFGELLKDGRSIDLLKVDVEGYENEVFRGATAVLEKYHPLIICEIEFRHNPHYAKVFGILRELAYDCYVFRGGQFEIFSGLNIEDIQQDKDLEVRLSENYDPKKNHYINNFVFQHAKSHIKVNK